MDRKLKYVLISVFLVIMITSIIIIFNDNKKEIQFNDISNMIFKTNSFTKFSMFDIIEEPKDIFREPLNGNFKSYNTSTKTLLIENDKYEILSKLRLLSNYKQSVPVGKDTKVAELLLVNFNSLENNLFELLQFYNIKNNYTSESKQFKLKYAIPSIRKSLYCQ